MATKKAVLALAVVGLMGASVAIADVLTLTSSPNAPILPDNGCVDDATGTGDGGITDVISFPAIATIADVDVAVEITHTWRGDLQIGLSFSGGGGTIVLANNHDTSGDNYYATFDDEGAAPCGDAANCGTGANCVAAPGPICQPDVALSAFDGLSATPGDFTLAICDRATGDLGTLLSWSVTVDAATVPVELMGFDVS